MRPAFHIEVVTPKKVALNGMWLGPRKAKRVIVWVHGLGSTMFSKVAIADQLVDRETAVLAFNNRGHDKVSSISRGRTRIVAGSVHEIFTDCVDDIEGAIRFAKSAGAREVFLAGHSTGCQKSVYWAAKKGTGVRGIILLAPISDYAAEVKLSGMARVAQGARVARSLVKQGKKHHLVQSTAANGYLAVDAQRYVSLYTGESEEEIFTYWAPGRVPKTLRSVKLPLLVLLAERDQYRDRPAKNMEAWFAEHLKEGDQIAILARAEHSFKGTEWRVARHMRDFMKAAAR